jgi:hypothetical protein
VSTTDVGEILTELRICTERILAEMRSLTSRVEDQKREIDEHDKRLRACEVSGRVVGARLAIIGAVGGAALGIVAALATRWIGG